MASVIDDFERCWRAVQSRDPRFDGWFYIAVATTGIYCRPSCPAVTPKRVNVSFHPTAAACQAAGFRACRRCRPDATPGSPQWNTRADVVGRAMRLIADGVVDRDGVAGLARALGYSPRHLHRQLLAEVGAGPIALARAQRAQTARVLLETTDLPCGDVAFAAGFGSIRQFNDTIAAVFALAPTELRRTRPKGTRPLPGAGAGALGEIRLRLPYREPFPIRETFEFLGQRAVAGVEAWDGVEYRRTLALPHGPGRMALGEGIGAGPGYVVCRLQLADLRDLATAVQRARRLLDLDADPVAVAEHLADDPLLAPAVAARPGRRIPGCVDGAELAVRAVLGQQVTVAGGRHLAGRLTARWGADLWSSADQVARTQTGVLGSGSAAEAPGDRSSGPGRAATAREVAPTRLFPSPSVIAGLDPADLGMPQARGRALIGLAQALAEGRISVDAGADRVEVQRRLVALPGIGPWTAAYVILRGLGDPDAFLSGDLGVRRALERAGLPGGPAAATRRAERWRPWRGYGLQYLWAA